MVTLQASPVTPTHAQLQATRQRIDAYIQSLANHPDRREGALPYYLFHPADTPISGTVLMFHGFSARPHQMSRLADYLFRNGFNVYQAALAGHAYRIPDQYWPQVDLKPEILIPLREKVSADPVLQPLLTSMVAASETSAVSPSPTQMLGLMTRLQQLEPRLLDIVAAIEQENSPEFDRYYVSSHLGYLSDAQTRLSELETMPGPVYTVGLSVGGAVALALGAKNSRVAKVVAFAPLLEVYGETRERYVNLAGPLDVREFGWDDLQFPLGCFTAANQFGAFVRKTDNVAALRPKPTLMVLTENEDAADPRINQSFAQSLGRASIFKRYDNHYLYTFPSAARVPHPMVDPLEQSQGMSNTYWKPMYQEVFRFLTQTEFNDSSLKQNDEVPDLPAVPPI
ncbi:alpha/beta hydrolase [filamentous cyanobacterium CCP3]|nr:alpha/beta hydrolase [filamentous cyanobacterium CCP3]